MHNDFSLNESSNIDKEKNNHKFLNTSNSTIFQNNSVSKIAQENSKSNDYNKIDSKSDLSQNNLIQTNDQKESLPSI